MGGGEQPMKLPSPQARPPSPHACLFNFVHSFFIPKHLVSTSCVPGSGLGTKDSLGEQGRHSL